jgi:penicillin-binding protein 1A
VELKKHCTRKFQKNKHHNKNECDSLKKIPISLNFKVEQNYDGIAIYFREELAKSLKPWCEENDIDLYADGIKIYTTIDTRMQKYAEEAVAKQMKLVQRNFYNHWGKEEPWRDENKQIIPSFIEDLAQKTSHYKSLSKKYPNQTDSVWAYLNKPRQMKIFDYKKGKVDTKFSTMESLRHMLKFMHAGFIAIEPQTGFIKAWVGDINFDFWKYDK